jgi:hypothetical protein
VAIQAERIDHPPLQLGLLILWHPFSHELFADPMAVETSTPLHSLVHPDHCRIFAMTLIALKSTGLTRRKPNCRHNEN